MARPRKPRPPRAQSRLVIRETGDGVEVSWAWYAPFCFVLLALYAAGLGVTYISLEGVRVGTVTAEWRRPALGLAIAWGVVSTWVTVAMFVNRTTVRVTAEALTVAQGPLYWPGGRRFRATDVTDVTVAEEVDATGDGEPVVTYRLFVYSRATYPRSLVAGIDNPKEAERIAGLVRAALRRVSEAK
jgi:hypothetical protein